MSPQVFCCKFGPYGDILASAGFDRQIFLWNVFGECENIACLPGKSLVGVYVQNKLLCFLLFFCMNSVYWAFLLF